MTLDIDVNTDTSLEIAEKLLEQEHILNMRRIEVLSQMMIKLAECHPKIKNLLNVELRKLKDLEKRINDLESTSASILSPS
jgi:predicted NUDIX family phosphoesterase